jgi:hypothetical protein
MKRAASALVGVVLCLATLPSFAQGIQSSILSLQLTGDWKQAAEIEKDTAAPGVQFFLDQKTGTLVQMRNDYEIRAVTEISQQFQSAGGSAATPEGSRILMKSMFSLPSKYMQSIASDIHGGRVAKLWEVRDPGNAEWFYISQLFGGYRVTGAGNSSEVQEQYIPLRVTRAEHKSAGRGDALLFEAETEKVAPEFVIKHFKLPPTLKDQKLRYGWIQFSPGGLNSSEAIISLAFATPVNSGFDVNTLLDEMVKSYGTKTQAQN